MNRLQLTHQLVLAMFVFNMILLQYNVLINTGAYRIMVAVQGMPVAWQFRCVCLPNLVRLAIIGIALVRTLPAMMDIQSSSQASNHSVSDPSVTPSERATMPERVQDVHKSTPSGDNQVRLQPESGGDGLPHKREQSRKDDGPSKDTKPRGRKRPRLRGKPVPKGDKFMPKVSLEHIRKCRKREKDAKAAITLLICEHRKKGYRIMDIVRMTCTPKTTVSRKLRRMHKEGLKGRKAKPKSGCPRKIDKNLEKDFAKSLTCKDSQSSTPLRGSESHNKSSDASRGSGVWTASTISDMLASKFGVTGISHSTIYRMLHRQRMSHGLIGRPTHPKAPSKRKKTWYKKGLAQRVLYWAAHGYTIVYMDEAYLNTKPNPGHTWRPIGSKGELTSPTRGVRVSLYGALGDGFSYIKQYDTGNTINTIDFLKQLHKDLKKVVVITDNASYHKSKELREYLATTNDEVKMEYIPPYSPDLNRIEWLWKEIKRHKANIWFEGTDSAADVVRCIDSSIYDGTIRLPPLPDYVLNGIRANKKQTVQNTVSRAAIP